MKLKVSMPGKKAIALTAFGFTLGGIAAYAATTTSLPLIGSLAHFEDSHATTASEHGKSLEAPEPETKTHAEKTPEHSGSVEAADGQQHGADTHGKQLAIESHSTNEHTAAEPSHAKNKATEQAIKDHAQASPQDPAHSEQPDPVEEKTSAKLEVTADHPQSKGAVSGEHAHWGYDGEGSPEQWAFLSPQYRTCGQGIEQTPIDLTSGIKGDVAPVFFSYKTQPISIANNGHTIQVGSTPGSFLTIGGKRYELAQFHFHHPSEHLMDGKAFPLEMHLVHKAADGALAVVGVFFKTGKANPQIEKIFSQMPLTKTPETPAKGTSNPSGLLPKSRAFYRYMGSLTTPPCTEGLTWTVFKEPLEVSEEQIDQFAKLFPHNARPVQPRNRRFLIEASTK